MEYNNKNHRNHDTILIVDDNPQNLKVLGNILRENAYKPVAAQSGTQALAFVQNEKPGLILLDIMMPEMDGYQVCEKLKSDEKTKDIPVIFLTAKTETEDLVRAFETGGADYVTKPFNSLELLTRVKSQLDLKKAEAELLHTAKMETVGLLSAGIAHDFNNLLSIIVGNLELMKLDLNGNAQSFSFLEKTEKALNQAAELVKKFLIISKGGWIEPMDIHLADVIRDAVDSVPGLKDMSCTVSLPEELKPFQGDPRQLRQVLVNLLSNAKEAISGMTGKYGNGKIGITAQVNTLEGDNVWSLKPGEYVKVTVSDNGPGIPDEVKGKILDPYFSTKERGSQKGMGMGLAVCHAILKRHSGHMAITTSPEKGTTVDFYLPVATG